MLDVGQELGWKEAGWGLPCVPGVGTTWDSLCVLVKPRQRLSILSEEHTCVHPTGH